MPGHQVFSFVILAIGYITTCLLYTSDAADERSSVDLGGRRIIKKKHKKKKQKNTKKKNKNNRKDSITEDINYTLTRAST